MKFLIVDFPQSNYISVKYWLQRNQQQVALFSEQNNESYDALVLPGVGAFDGAVDYMRQHGIDKCINEFIQQGKLVMGICLGMQLFFSSSDEGGKPGLGLIQGHVASLHAGSDKVPNIGWRSVAVSQNETEISRGRVFGSFDCRQFYFMHGYAAHFEGLRSDFAVRADVLSADCNGEFIAAFCCDNIVGFQFHPEKSYSAGDMILRRVIEVYE